MRHAGSTNDGSGSGDWAISERCSMFVRVSVCWRTNLEVPRSWPALSDAFLQETTGNIWSCVWNSTSAGELFTCAASSTLRALVSPGRRALPWTGSVGDTNKRTGCRRDHQGARPAGFLLTHSKQRGGPISLQQLKQSAGRPYSRTGPQPPARGPFCIYPTVSLHQGTEIYRNTYWQAVLQSLTQEGTTR